MKNTEQIILSNEKKILFLVFLLALILRLFVIFNLPEQYTIPSADAADYNNYALDILAGKGFVNHQTGLSTAYHAPLYPVFLAFLYLIFGIKNYFAVMIVQCIMSALLTLMIFYIGKIIFNAKVGLLAAIWLSFYKPYIFFCYYGGPAFLLSENLFNPLFLITVLFMIKKIFAGQALKNDFILGILIGILILTRAVFALFPILLLALLIYKNKRSFSSALREGSVLFIALAIVILPWTIRNYFLLKAFVPLTTQGGFGLLSGNNPLVNGGGQTDMDRMLSREEKNRYDEMSEVEKDKFLKRVALDFLVKNYRKLPVLSVKKILVLWDIFLNDYNLAQRSSRRIYNVWYAIVFMFSLIGIRKALKSRFGLNLLLLLSFFVYTTIIVMITGGDPRHRYYFEPFLIIFASAGIFTIYNAFKKKLLSCAMIGAVIGINLLIYLHSDLFLGLVRCAWRLL